MRILKPTLFGAFGGLAAALAALVGLYLSPLRQELYFSVDPELADVRAKLATYQEWLGQADTRIAAQEAAGPGSEADSLRTEQARVWHDYKSWRTRLGELARAHAQPGGMLFLRWTYSLRYWSGPGLAAAALLPALLAGWRARNRYRPSRTRPGRAPRDVREDKEPPAQRALSEFQDAIKQVARISQPKAEAPRSPAAPAVPPTDAIPIAKFTEGDAPVKEPETVPLSLEPDGGPGPGPEDGRETRFFQVGPGWGQPPADPRIAKPDLPMEDEDAPREEGNVEDTPGVMPPTTEVERVERRKEEVLKLARKGLTSSEISRRLRISQDQVEFIIRLRREKG